VPKSISRWEEMARIFRISGELGGGKNNGAGVAENECKI